MSFPSMVFRSTYDDLQEGSFSTAAIFKVLAMEFNGFQLDAYSESMQWVSEKGFMHNG